MKRQVRYARRQRQLRHRPARQVRYRMALEAGQHTDHMLSDANR
jgi:hypothetical protein